MLDKAKFAYINEHVPQLPAGKTPSSDAGDKLDAMQKKNVLKLLKKRATRFDKVRLEYEARFRHELILDTKLSSWLQTIDGLHFDHKNQIVSSGEHQFPHDDLTPSKS